MFTFDKGNNTHVPVLDRTVGVADKHKLRAEFKNVEQRRLDYKKFKTPLAKIMLLYRARSAGGFFFSLINTSPIINARAYQTWSAGNKGVATKAARRANKNILSWWHFIFAEHLYVILATKDHNYQSSLHFFFTSINNLTLRYLFMNNVYVNAISNHDALYLLRYDFYSKYHRLKKRRDIKKFKIKNIVHADRFSRREFWIGL